MNYTQTTIRPCEVRLRNLDDRILIPMRRFLVEAEGKGGGPAVIPLQHECWCTGGPFSRSRPPLEIFALIIP